MIREAIQYVFDLGGAWRSTARRSIAAWLAAALPGVAVAG